MIDISGENVVLVGALLLFVAVIAGKVAYRFGAPALLLFLGVGMLFGLNFISFRSVEMTQFVGMIALCIILFTGGMDTKFSEIKPIIGPGVVLATAGVVMTAFILASFVWLVAPWLGIEMPFVLALLLASTMSSTDSASVFSILRSKKQGLKQNLRPLLELLDTPAEILEDAYRYIIIIDLGVIVMFAYNLCAGLLRAIGNSVMPLVFLLLSSALNVVLDLWFIAGMGMGVAGAAVATVIAQGVSVVLCILYVMARVRILIPGRKHLDVGRKLYWDLFSQSISMGLMSSIVSAGSVILQYGINGLGTLTIAGHTAARKLFAFTDMPLIAMANAASTFVSQNYGAGQPERIRKGMREIYLYSLVVMVVTVLLMQVSAEWLVRMVSGSSEALVLENGARYLRWTSPFYAVLGVLLSTRYALQSLGEKVLPLFSSVIEFLGKVVFVLVFIPRFAYNAVILCEPVVWCFMALYLVAVYRCNPFVFPKKQ